MHGSPRAKDMSPSGPIVTSRASAHASLWMIILRVLVDNIGYRWQEWRTRHDDFYVSLNRLNR